MKKELMDILCCPSCKSELKLSIIKEENDDIIQGDLTCEKCIVKYPITDGIPNLLPKKLSS